MGTGLGSMVEMLTQTASCLCGDCVIAVSSAPLLVTIDSASDSQTLASGPFRWVAYFPEADTKTGGTYISYRHDVRDGTMKTFWRCANCGTQMWFRSVLSMPGTVGVNAAAFGAPDLFAPTRASHRLNRPKWALVDPSIDDSNVL